MIDRGTEFSTGPGHVREAQQVPLWRRLATGVGAMLLGVWVGALALVLHRQIWTLAIALGLTLAIMIWAIGQRSNRLSFAFGWLIVVVLSLFPRPEGDILLDVSWQSYTLLGLGVAVFVLALVLAFRPTSVH